MAAQAGPSRGRARASGRAGVVTGWTGRRELGPLAYTFMTRPRRSSRAPAIPSHNGPVNAPAPVTTSVWPGSHQPLGATWGEESTNFAVFAPEATACQLCLFDERRRARPGYHADREDPGHLARRGARHRAGTALRLPRRRPVGAGRGRMFNPAKLLLDPYARAVSGSTPDGPIYGRPTSGHDAVRAARRTARRRDSAPYVPRSVVVRDDFDWGDDELVRPRTRWTDTVVYELHVKGFTQLHNEVPEELRGTYAGLTTDAAVHYLKDLGVTDGRAAAGAPVRLGAGPRARGLTNYWGYNSIGFFAPHNAYSSAGDRGQQVTEFKAMVKALHAAGLEVILDVVYNHTAEGSPLGPTLSFRGLDDIGYYKHVDWVNDGATYFDVTGCGNTVDAAYPPALRLILDSLRYWVTEMHVDGFRFDLTPALTRTGHRVDLQRALHHHDRPGPGAAAREADRRAVGRQHGRLPGRPVPAALVRVERQVPRHRAGLLAARLRRHPRRRLPAGRAPPTCTPTTAGRRTPRSTS